MISVAIIIGGLIFAAVVCASAYVSAATRRAAPVRELARAVRAIDRALAYDDAVSSLSSEIRAEFQSIVDTYNKELTK